MVEDEVYGIGLCVAWTIDSVFIWYCRSYRLEGKAVLGGAGDIHGE